MNQPLADISIINALVNRIFPTNPLQVERVTEGVSTCVYRIVFRHETFYLRVLPEEGASFAPEVAVHTRLRQLQVRVPEVIYFDQCYEPLQRSVMVTTEINGDFDTTHIFQENGRYIGIIDFGEIRGANRWYDPGHFHMRDGEYISYSQLPVLMRGYSEVTSLPPNYENAICFASILINVRALARSLQKRPPDCYTRHQIKVLKEDMAVLLV